MAGTQITTYTTIVTESMKGFMALTLDEWTTTNEPEITEGSRVEISGSLFKFDANEDIDPDADWAGFGNSTQIYGYFVVAGANVTSKLTITAPTWEEEKQGWYDATSTYRYWGGIYKDAGGNYADKFIYAGRSNKITVNNIINERGNIDLSGFQNDDKEIDFASDASILWDESEDEFYFNKSIKVDDGIETDGIKLKTKRIAIGAWDMNSNAGVSVAHGLTFTDIISVTGVIITDTGNDMYTIGSVINSSGVSNVGFREVTPLTPIDSTNINIYRVAGSVFATNAEFNGAGNRGYLYVVYVA